MGRRAKDSAGHTICCGVASLVAVQSFINICVATGLMPNTGTPLPFVSYGGSSVLVSLMMMGLLQWVCVYCEQRAQEELLEAETGGGAYE